MVAIGVAGILFPGLLITANWIAGGKVIVYPPAEHRVPRWLNEGLAQVFETAVVENGVPHFNSPDPVRLERIRQALAATRKGPTRR